MPNRAPQSSMGQSVKTVEKGANVAYYMAKYVKGRKHDLLVDVLGLVLLVIVHSAAIQEQDGANSLTIPGGRWQINNCIKPGNLSWLGHQV